MDGIDKSLLHDIGLNALLDGLAGMRDAPSWCSTMKVAPVKPELSRDRGRRPDSSRRLIAAPTPRTGRDLRADLGRGRGRAQTYAGGEVCSDHPQGL